MIQDYIVSENANFKCFVLSTNIPKEEMMYSIITPDKEVYLCCEAGQSFKISIKAINEEIIYGAKLFIDDQDVYGVKTFKKTGTFIGVKKSGGKYNEFVFKRPKMEQGIDSIARTIRIEFFNTFKKNLIKREMKSKHIEEKMTIEDKKFFLHPLTVSEGKEIKCYNKNKNLNNKVFCDFVDFRNMIDKIEFFYSDITSLELMGKVY
jgi:hypothetical protein